MMSASRPNEAGPDCFQESGLDYQPILVNTKCWRTSTAKSCELLRKGIGEIFKLSIEVCRVLWEIVEAWDEVESQLDYRRTDVRKYSATSSQLKTLEIVLSGLY